MKFFQIFMLIATVLSTIGVLAEERGKSKYVALFTTSGILYLAAWTLSKIYF